MRHSSPVKHSQNTASGAVVHSLTTAILVRVRDQLHQFRNHVYRDLLGRHYFSRVISFGNTMAAAGSGESARRSAASTLAASALSSASRFIHQFSDQTR